jgi:ATP-binding cassette subfamily F protein 3
VLVSHDRALLRTVCDGFLLAVDGGAREFEGDLEDYLAWEALRATRSVETVDPTRGDKAERREARANATIDRQAKLARRRPLLQEAERLEQELEHWQ